MSEPEVVTNKPTVKFLVRVNYKSGTSMEMWCEEFNAKHNSGVLTSLSYTTIAGDTAKPLFFGNLESVESVYQLRSEPIDN
jgi:hypothetical protein